MMASTIWHSGGAVLLGGFVAGLQKRPEHPASPARRSRRPLSRYAREHFDDHFVAGIEVSHQGGVRGDRGLVVDEQHDGPEVELALDDAAQGLDRRPTCGFGLPRWRRCSTRVRARRALGSAPCARRSIGGRCCGPLRRRRRSRSAAPRGCRPARTWRRRGWPCGCAHAGRSRSIPVRSCSELYQMCTIMGYLCPISLRGCLR